MPKVTRKDLDAAVEDARKLSGLRLILHDVPGGYGVRLLGASAEPGLIHSEWLSPQCTTRDELMIWVHGFTQGLVLGAER